MESIVNNNLVQLLGTVDADPEFSHRSREREFYTVPFSVRRLSGAEDRVNLTLDSAQLRYCRAGERLGISGELRSFNNRSGVGSKLVISVFVRHLEPCEGEDLNRVELAGTICKRPTYRRTPMGREICDLMLAVNRRYGRSDYLPCIAWGAGAAFARDWDVGQRAALFGRLQSRKYIKTDNGVSSERTAFEVSVIEFL